MKITKKKLEKYKAWKKKALVHEKLGMRINFLLSLTGPFGEATVEHVKALVGREAVRPADAIAIPPDLRDDRCEACERSMITRFGGPAASEVCESCEADDKRYRTRLAHNTGLPLLAKVWSDG